MNSLPKEMEQRALCANADGTKRVDLHSVLALAVPLMANSGIQIALNLTDIWFIGRISTRALAGVAAVQWLVVVITLVLGGGVGLAVQTVVAQAYGANRFERAAQAVWTALWASLCVLPAFVAAATASRVVLAPFDIDPQTELFTERFWFPRVAGGAFGTALWAVLAFFNGIGQPRMTLIVTMVTAVANAVFNEVFIFGLGLGIAGSGWATTAAQVCGLLCAMRMFLNKEYRDRYQSHLTWRPNVTRIIQQLRLGIPTGLLLAADLVGFSIFQIMQVHLGVAAGAATLMVIALTSVAYVPGSGIALAGTTLVGQAIGGGDRQWAMRVGTRTIALVCLCMGVLGVLTAVTGPWLLPMFARTDDRDTAEAVQVGIKLLWLAAVYQFFDGLALGASLSLRGGGDIIVPAVLVLSVSWLMFLPLVHSFTFAPGQGWVRFLPQFGWGAVGGWSAVVIYQVIIGTALYARWRSGAWQALRLSSTGDTVP